MTTQQPVAPPERKRLLYGRRRGRPLRTGQRGLIDDLLPRVSLELPDGGTLDPAALFDTPPNDIWVEIGFGGGEHLAAQAAAHPDVGMLGCEVFENGIVKLLTEMQRLALTNIRLLSDDARLLLAALPAESVGRAFILFPDPWPKMRHHKRRIVSTETLDTLGGLMKDGAELRIATDDLGYLEWMLGVVTVHRDFAWLAETAADWRIRPADWPPTRYEAKAIAAGRKPYFLRLARRPRGART
jgi:tRNA (guanine-N7-)-methyltransferase